LSDIGWLRVREGCEIFVTSKRVPL